MSAGVMTFNVEIDGERFLAEEGQTIAGFLVAHGVLAWRRTEFDEPRGVFCGIGICHDCVVTVDGVAGVKACLMPVRAGMQILTTGPGS